MYMDSSQLDELVDALIICHLRIINKTLRRSDSMYRLSNYLIFLGMIGLVFITFFVRSHWSIWLFVLLIMLANYTMHLSTNIVRSLHVPSRKEVIEQANLLKLHLQKTTRINYDPHHRNITYSPRISANHKKSL